MIFALVLYLSIAVNLGGAIFNFNQARRYYRRLRELNEHHDAMVRDVISSFMPALALCVALREDPHAPPRLRQQAEAAIPNTDRIHVDITMVAPDQGKVH